MDDFEKLKNQLNNMEANLESIQQIIHRMNANGGNGLNTLGMLSEKIQSLESTNRAVLIIYDQLCEEYGRPEWMFNQK